MLVLARKKDESVRVGQDVEVVVLEIRGNLVRLGFRAPQDQVILRTELMPRVEKAARERPVRVAC